MNKDDLIHFLKVRGIPDKITEVFEKVDRREFVPDRFREYAYEHMALPLEDGSTTSQPYVIAFMLELLDLKQGNKVLEIGSGSGFVLALISQIIKNGKIYGVEINKNLAIKSKKLLSNDSNIEIFNRSGFSGFPKNAPYDRILISASCSDMRIPYNILDQLSPNGIMVVPVQSSVFLIKKVNGKTEEKEFPGFAFVPLRKEE